MAGRDRPLDDVVLKKRAQQSLGVTMALWHAFMHKFMTMNSAPEAWVRPMEDGTLEIFYILPPGTCTTEGKSVAGGELLLLQVPQGGWEYKQ